MTDDIVQPLKPNRVSLSTQAQQYLLRLVEDGVYQPGEQLPSETDLASQLGISRPTLREALQNLEQEGIVLRRHGVGTFVARSYEGRLESGLERLESILELAARQGMQLAFDDLQVDTVPADRDLCDSLQVAPSLPVTRVRRVIVADGRPVAYMEDLVPTSIIAPEAVDAAFTGSVLDLLRQQQALQIVRAVADIVALNAGARLAGRLAIEPGRAVLLLEEVVFDAEGRALDCSRNYFVPEFFRFHLVRTC
jgi:GntR family transcriptional regulator